MHRVPEAAVRASDHPMWPHLLPQLLPARQRPQQPLPHVPHCEPSCHFLLHTAPTLLNMHGGFMKPWSAARVYAVFIVNIGCHSFLTDDHCHPWSCSRLCPADQNSRQLLCGTFCPSDRDAAGEHQNILQSLSNLQPEDWVNLKSVGSRSCWTRLELPSMGARISMYSLHLC